MFWSWWSIPGNLIHLECVEQILHVIIMLYFHYSIGVDVSGHLFYLILLSYYIAANGIIQILHNLLFFSKFLKSTGSWCPYLCHSLLADQYSEANWPIISLSCVKSVLLIRRLSCQWCWIIQLTMANIDNIPLRTRNTRSQHERKESVVNVCLWKMISTDLFRDHIYCSLGNDLDSISFII